jgi:hypothetical protein
LPSYSNLCLCWVRLPIQKKQSKVSTISGTISIHGGALSIWIRKSMKGAISALSFFSAILVCTFLSCIESLTHMLFTHSRDDKRYTEKKNKSERARRKKEDTARLRSIVDLCLGIDPRIKRIKLVASLYPFHSLMHRSSYEYLPSLYRKKKLPAKHQKLNPNHPLPHPRT